MKFNAEEGMLDMESRSVCDADTQAVFEESENDFRSLLHKTTSMAAIDRAFADGGHIGLSLSLSLSLSFSLSLTHTCRERDRDSCIHTNIQIYNTEIDLLCENKRTFREWILPRIW